ncbi:hypothetical protein [Motilimonas eburnea]|uniref:hypothetical protein n=1 Tax=Motilimonas eburnea TaxID=1737488 RepID=UPI001E2C435B|nr:hypothetical protein [Motilimonas eburnea]MCE2570647.1 hypothetical protein [Motilimonas eburnea]
MSSKKSLPAPLIIFAGFILLLLFCASLLGENARSEQVTKDYFNAIAELKFSQVSHYLSEQGEQGNQDVAHLFALEAALQQHFNLAMDQAYLVETKQQSYWLPYLLPAVVSVAVKFSPITEGQAKQQSRYIDGMVELVREENRWRIKAIKLPEDIQSDYLRAKAQINQQKHIEIQDQQIRLAANTINTQQLDPLTQKLWLFQLNNAMTAIANATPVTEKSDN